MDLEGKVIQKVDTSNLTVQPDTKTMIVRSTINSEFYPIVYDLSNSPVEIGQKIIEPAVVSFIIGLMETFSDGTILSVANFKIDAPSSPDVALVTNDGWEVKFTTSDSINNQKAFLLAVLNEQIKDRKNLDYIDLRYGEKVFYQ